MCSFFTKYALPHLLCPLFAKKVPTLKVFYNLKLQLDPDILTESENRSFNFNFTENCAIFIFIFFFMINLSTKGSRRVWITGEVKPTSTWMILMKMVIKMMMMTMMILNNLYDWHWTKRWSDSCSPPRRRCRHSTWGPRRYWQPGIRWFGLWSKAILLSLSFQKRGWKPMATFFKIFFTMRLCKRSVSRRS